MKNYIRERLLEKHGTPDDSNALEEYINFISDYSNELENYNEIHHILPRCEFPEFVNSEWNLIKMDYHDHIKAHELLFRSFNTRFYQMPLNYMKPEILKNSELVSNSAKKDGLILRRMQKSIMSLESLKDYTCYH